MRYDSLIFWLDANDAALKDRLNKRVDVMVGQGLFNEAEEMADFAQKMQQENISLDKSKGIWVSIGYKELEPWLDHLIIGKVGKSAKKLRESCIEAVKAGTRRYAKRQNRYIRIRLANALAETNALDKLFLLDCTDLSEWHNKVAKKAGEIVDLFLTGKELPQPAELSDLASSTLKDIASTSEPTNGRVARKCDICDKILMTDKEWQNHIQSRSHQKVAEGVRRRAVRVATAGNARTNAVGEAAGSQDEHVSDVERG